jgi:hypothetical protein
MILSDTAAVAVAVLLSHTGWGALSMSMARHSRETLPSRFVTRSGRLAAMRSIATLVIVLSTFPLVLVWGAPIGLVAWSGVLSLSCVLLALQLHYAARTLRVTMSLAGLGAVSIALLTQLAAHGSGAGAA